VLFPVGGKAMLDYLLDRYAPFVDRFFVVVRPEDESAVRRHCARRSLRVELAVQSRPTGMLDAILVAGESVRRQDPAAVWVTWCDQIAIRGETAAALAEWSERDPEAVLIFPTMRGPEPYIHFVRDAGGEICAVLHRREGDDMPETGESDVGLFHLSARGYFELLPEFTRQVTRGPATGERNFLPFIPWLRGRGRVCTFAGREPIEALGANTPADVERLERHFRDGC
ncbi:MAG: nucleotidyltransferase family protein, partial [Candidatus Binatia bacterium]